MPPKKLPESLKANLPRKIGNSIKAELQFSKEKKKVKQGEKQGKTPTQALSEKEFKHYRNVKNIHKEFKKNLNEYKNEKVDSFKKYMNKLVGKAMTEHEPEPRSTRNSTNSRDTEIASVKTIKLQ